ncbi:MAG: hypothetical protein R3245_01970, partial [Kiloniellales bacterium]|nr:hypothetical protein [Kiloniellales bacterium]
TDNLVVTVNDDGPTLLIEDPAPGIIGLGLPPVSVLAGAVTVDESDLLNGAIILDGNLNAFFGVDLAAPADATHGEGIVDVTLTSSVPLSSNGEAVNFAYDAIQDLWVGTIANGTTEVLSLRFFDLANPQPQYSFSLFQTLDHLDALGQPVAALDLDFAVTIADRDGDLATDNLVVTVNDDGSAPITPLTAPGGGPLIGGPPAPSILQGDGSDDILIGNSLKAVDETFFGHAGDDVLIGNDGDDRLTGGVGSDTFAFSLADDGLTAMNDGADVITDFERSLDILRFNDVLEQGPGDAGTLDDAIISIIDSGENGNVTVSFDNGASIVFEGVGTGAIATIEDLVDDPAKQVLVNAATT